MKQVSPKEAVRIRNQARKNGTCVVFTNGCFDLLHEGHRSCLFAARSMGDLLIVGLNSDDSVRRLKGSDRPVNPLAKRIADLSSVEPVGHIVVFEEDTPEALLTALEPDILVKGADYKRDEIVGRDIVERGGGRVETVPYIAGKSTTRKFATSS